MNLFSLRTIQKLALKEPTLTRSEKKVDVFLLRINDYKKIYDFNNLIEKSVFSEPYSPTKVGLYKHLMNGRTASNLEVIKKIRYKNVIYY
jgi:hypothetical protein